MDLDPNRPGDLSRFNNDEFAGVVDHYLTPALHCDVSIVAPPSGGDGCVVVRVPSHGPVLHDVSYSEQPTLSAMQLMINSSGPCRKSPVVRHSHASRARHGAVRGWRTAVAPVRVSEVAHPGVA